MSTTMTQCEHDNGEMFPNLSGTCIKCGADLDKVYFQKRLEDLENRLYRLEQVSKCCDNGYFGEEHECQKHPAS